MQDVEKTLALQAYRMGHPLPDRIANAPELKLGLGLYLQAFTELDTDRQSSFGMMPISHSTIRDYATAYDFDLEQKDDLFYFVRVMDNFYLAWAKKKNG